MKPQEHQQRQVPGGQVFINLAASVVDNIYLLGREDPFTKHSSLTDTLIKFFIPVFAVGMHRSSKKNAGVPGGKFDDAAVRHIKVRFSLSRRFFLESLAGDMLLN